MVSLAHKFAFESPHITADAVSAVHAAELARQYRISGTPHTVINGRRHLRGRLTAGQLWQALAP